MRPSGLSAATFGADHFSEASRRLNRLALSLMSAAAIAGAPLLAAFAPHGAAAETTEQAGPREDGLIRSHQVDGGALLLKTDKPGLYVQAPLLATDIDVAIAGPVGRAVVTQRFTNPAKVYVEGKYVFPLPEGSAVDVLRMRVGDRLIEGDIKERVEAKKIYETAKAEGYVASLVEQERPNVFTTSVANIGPGESVTIQIEYQETFAPRDGVFGMRLPLVVAPRYSPKPRASEVKFGPKGWYVALKDPVADRGRVSPPVADPREEEPGSIRNPVEITVDLQAGFPLGTVNSLYHKVNIDPSGVNGARITLKGPTPANKDFYLSWKPESIDEPYLSLFTEGFERAPGAPAGEGAGDKKVKERSYLMMLTPPAAEAIGDTRRPREVIFVQDVSGSMHGKSMEQARKGLEMAVRRLAPEDRFNIIVFNDRFDQFSDAPLPATPENIEKAVTSIRALKADGGTEMLPALAVALQDDDADAARREGRVRQVIFLTDGAVSNEREMLELIEKKLGRSRLFTVGIGSAPNSYFMTAAAEAGRGAHVFIGDLGEVQDRMEALFKRIETPAMTDLALEVAGFEGTEIWPNPLPDLYAGDPVVATIRVDESRPTRAVPELAIRGKRGGEAWERRLRLAAAKERVGVAKLWARQKIRSLEALRISQSSDGDARKVIDKEILATALDYGLVSRLTSLVAVDVTPTRPKDEELVSKDVPLNLPDGWDPRFFFEEPGKAPAGFDKAEADLDELPIVKAAMQRLERAAEARAKARALKLPDTAANWAMTLLIGLAMLALGVAGMLLSRRRSASSPGL